MAEVKRIVDLITSDESVTIDGTYLGAITSRDGYTDTYEGDYWYKVEKSGSDYKVVPVIIDTEGEITYDDPIIVTEGNTIFYIVKTNRDSYSFPELQQKELAESEVIEKQVLQAFLAFAKDRFRIGTYNNFLADEPKLDADPTAPAQVTPPVEGDE